MHPDCNTDLSLRPITRDDRAARVAVTVRTYGVRAWAVWTLIFSSQVKANDMITDKDRCQSANTPRSHLNTQTHRCSAGSHLIGSYTYTSVDTESLNGLRISLYTHCAEDKRTTALLGGPDERCKRQHKVQAGTLVRRNNFGVSSRPVTGRIILKCNDLQQWCSRDTRHAAQNWHSQQQLQL